MRLDGGIAVRGRARGVRLGAVVALTLLALLAGACGGDDDSSSSSLPPEGAPGQGGGKPASGPTPGVTDDTITISVSGPRTGLGDFYAAGEKAGFGVWLNEINANGGINGRKIEILKVDNQLTPDGAIAACQEEKDNGSLFAVIGAGYSSEATCLEQAGVPSLTALVDQVDPKWTTMVHYLQSVETWGTNPADLIKEVAPKSKVGVLYLRDMAYGFVAKGAFEKRAEELGLDVVDTESVAQGQASFVAELQRLRSAGAETAVMFVVTDALGILRDAASIDFEPRWVGAGFGFDALSQAARESMQGVISVRTYATKDIDAYADYVAKLEKYGDKDAKPSAEGMGGYGQGLVVQELLELAGPNPTRESLVAAFEKIDGFETNGVYAPISWKGRLEGTTETFAERCCAEDFTWQAFGPKSSGT